MNDDLGHLIDQGCHAAVYEARISKLFVQNSSIHPPLSDHLAVIKDYPLAMKIMFNYDFYRSNGHLWDEMGAEMVPLVSNHNVQRRFRPRPLSEMHPNVVQMYVAFIDTMPRIPGAELLYPEALPPFEFGEPQNPPPRTLFLLMKRYRMTLREYIDTIKRNYWHCRVLLGQLLEAVVFLYEQSVSHRDMKSDNILVDFNSKDETPYLVVSDFGCCMSSGTFKLRYPCESIDLGGNLSLRAPEIRTARPGPNTILDYRNADLWATGALGYELLTGENPFCSRLRSHDYQERDLPSVVEPFQALFLSLLRIDPTLRPDPRVAANMTALSLFRAGDNADYFGVFDHRSNHSIDQLACFYAAETIIARHRPIDGAELQLRATFLRRFDRNFVRQAIDFYFHDASI